MSTVLADRNHLAARRRYRVDLRRQQACCEANYLRLSKLMNTMDAERFRFALQRGERQLQVELLIAELSPYTTTLELSCQEDPQTWLHAPRMKVRLYHDAHMAEVIEWRGERRSTLPVIQPAGHQPDERLQWNLFLSEWLSHCLQFGYHLEALPFSQSGEQAR